MTQILTAAERCEPPAEELLPLVYDELRLPAAVQLAKGCSGHTLQTTALIREGGRHLFRDAARAMRRIVGGAGLLYCALWLQAAQDGSPAVGLRPVTFAAPISLPACCSPLAVVAGDFNGDEHADLAALTFQGEALHVWLGRGDGTFRQVPAPFQHPQGGSDLALADDRRGGGLDLIVANSYSPSIVRYFGRGTGTFGEAKTNLVDHPAYKLAAGDLNGDGIVDVVFASLEPDGLFVLLGKPDGSLGKASKVEGVFCHDQLILQDLNGDGTLDLVATDWFRDRVSVLVGRGDGTFGPAEHLSAKGSPAAVVAGDFNADGKPDLVTANQDADSISVFLGHGDGTFAPPLEYEAGNLPYCLAAGDLNGDNRPDLIVAHQQNPELQVLLGAGDGSFRGPVRLQAGRGVRSIAIADFNHDGLPDLATANPFDQTVSVFLNTTGTSGAGSPGLVPVVAAPRKQQLEVIDAEPLTAGNSLGDYHAETWTTDRGLPQNTIQCLLQTRNGYLWVGTPSGLARFDGLRFTTYDRYDTPALKSDNILATAEGPKGTLWIGTGDGLIRYRNHRFTRFSTADLRAGLDTRQVFAVCPDPAGGVWVGANGLLAHLQDERFAVVSTNSGGVIHSLLEDRTGGLWVGTGQAVLRREADTNGWSPIYLGFDNRVFGEQSGSLWFGNAAGLWQYERGQLSVHRAKHGLSNGLVRSLAQDPGGDVWIVAGQRLHRLRDGRFSRVGAEAGLPDDAVSCVYADREGNIWVGTSRSGLVRLNPCQFVTYNSRDGLADDRVVSISASPDGILWFATDAGLSRLSGETFSTFNAPLLPDVADGNALRSVLADGSGEVWAGGKALFTVKGERLECWEPQAQRFFRFVDSLYRDRAGALWATTESGLWRIKGVERDLYTGPGWTNIFNDGARPGALAGCTVYTNAPPWPGPLGVLDDRQSNLWVGSRGAGLHRLRDGQFTTLTTTNGLTSDYACPLKADPDGTLWVGSDKGLNRLKDGCITRYTTAEGLAENIVGNLLEDDQGWLWTMGHRGLHRMLKQELIEFAEGKRHTITAISYGTADGMLSSEANVGCFPNACQTPDGLLWFPTTRGVLVVEPHLLETRDVPPPIVLEQVLADGEIICGDGARPAVEARLAPGRARLLEFHYTASLFRAPEQVRFKYKLEGHDSQWGEAGTRRTAVYTDVAPGKYRFRVLALSPQGLESETPAEFTFSLAPHLYQTRWFYALTALGVVLSAGGLHRLRVVRLAHRQQVEHELELALERERIAKDMHDDLGASLTQIGLLSEHARRNAIKSPEVAADIEKIATATRQTAQAAEEMVWVMSSRHDTLDSLATYLCQLAREYLEPSGFRCRLDVPAQLPDIRVPSETRHNIVLFVKEALNNTVKHSAAREVWLALKITDHTLTLALLDDGCGFEMSPSSIKSHPFRNGNGLLNLRQRAEAMGGQFELRSHPGQGTCVKVIVRLVP